MPSMASITVKKNDGTTDIVFDALSGAGGDSSPAVWRQDTGVDAGYPVGVRPLVRLWSTSNGPKTARVMRFHIAFPYAYQDASTTLVQAKDRAVLEGVFTLPVAIPAASLNEACAQAVNLLASSLIKSAFQSGYAPV